MKATHEVKFTTHDGHTHTVRGTFIACCALYDILKTTCREVSMGSI